MNFALFSAYATGVDLCLFDSAQAHTPSATIKIKNRTDQVWHVFVRKLKPGQLYAYRVHGSYEPEKGLRFNPHKFLLDPYARALGRDVKWDTSLFAYETSGSETDDLFIDEESNGAHCPLAMVVAPLNPAPNKLLKTPWHKTIIYEAHVRGMTALHPQVPEKLRGTYAGLATRPVIQHLHSLGVTAIELLPIHHRTSEWHLLKQGLSNYWGYNTLGYFLPDSRFGSVDEPAELRAEFRAMVDAFHDAGIEVIIDVVYNHTAEGNHLGPTLSFRGIDNRSYYRLAAKEPRYYADVTGCGNSMNVAQPRVLQLIADSMRYWVEELHVDGFRFDLATVLGRDDLQYSPHAAFFDIVQQDPVLSQSKLIAEPWDLGDAGYQVGNFPVMWREWNGRYRDALRSFWRGEKRLIGSVASRIAGSSDFYELGGRSPCTSINFITCHDGFTLSDLVSYNHKHNLDNKEHNRDGNNDNRSWNCGHEGATTKPTVLKLRERQRRNLIASLLLSAGVPMLLGGDELGRSQRGNNNAYCQDNELGWLNWELNAESQAFLDFVKALVRIRNSTGTWRRKEFFKGVKQESGEQDVTWIKSDGKVMAPADWSNPDLHLLGALFGRADAEHGVSSPAFLLLLNAEHIRARFSLPQRDYGWELIVDTALETPMIETPILQQTNKYAMVAHSLVLFREASPEINNKKL